LRDVYQLLQFEVGHQDVDREDGLKMWVAALNTLIKQAKTTQNGHTLCCRPFEEQMAHQGKKAKNVTELCIGSQTWTDVFERPSENNY
jgi:hypothetical protein